MVEGELWARGYLAWVPSRGIHIHCRVPIFPKKTFFHIFRKKKKGQRSKLAIKDLETRRRQTQTNQNLSIQELERFERRDLHLCLKRRGETDEEEEEKEESGGAYWRIHA